MSKRYPEPPFPTLIKLRGRNYVWRSHLERYKEELTRHALGSREAPLPPLPQKEGDSLVPLKVASAELGAGRRTIGRRIKDAQSEGEAA
jgi:hypothetical protein